MRSNLRFFLLALLVASAPAWAGDTPPKLEPIPSPPPPPAGVMDDEQAPDVTIVQREDAQVAEYRMKGKLYMVKVTPKVGKPYYLIDAKGDGVFAPYNPDGNKVSVPMWVIKRW